MKLSRLELALFRLVGGLFCLAIWYVIRDTQTIINTTNYNTPSLSLEVNFYSLLFLVLGICFLILGALGIGILAVKKLVK